MGFLLAPNASVADDGEPSKNEASEVTTVGDDDVDPIEINGQVLDVNEKPASKSMIRLSGISSESLFTWSSSITTDEEGRFRVRLRIKKERLPQLKLTAVKSDSSQIAYYRFPWNQEAPSEPIKIQMVTARIAQLKVVDKSGVPIDKANAAIELTYPLFLWPGL